MSSVHAKIQEAASQNAFLLQGLHETDSAPSQLRQQDAYINDLNAQMAKINAKVTDLKEKTATELKDHEKYRDSNVRRFAHKAMGRKEKFAEKAAKEEKEYFDAMQAQKSAEDELTYVQHLKSEAEGARKDYAASAERHNYLQNQLDALYNSIFAGHTPDFPLEDRAEESCNTAQHHLSSLHQRMEMEKHLSDARTALDGAYSMSQYDLFGGGTMASMQKRNYLERAESCIQQVRMLQQQLPHDVPQLGELQIASGSIWSDVVFDNIFTDMDMHEKVKQSIAQVDRVGAQCGDIIRGREEGLKRLQREVTEAEEGLKKARVELQRAREDAFRRVVEGQSGMGEGPPGYAAPSGAPPGYTV
ncbi:hypothetical protein HBH75_093390 [Parastagonospora nodorum]|nr:hypothetical protein HBH75_093390 [Parastagonospora nodorum]